MKRLTRNYGRADFLEFVSPDFTSFIDVDLARKNFMIRDMQTEEILYEKGIPSYLMNYQNDPEEVLLKFKWVGNDMFKIINKSGMEKLVDIGTEFRQEQFNQIANYDHDVEQYRNFYTDRAPLEKNEVSERLIRKAQAYKTA